MGLFTRFFTQDAPPPAAAPQADPLAHLKTPNDGPGSFMRDFKELRSQANLSENRVLGILAREPTLGKDPQTLHTPLTMMAGLDYGMACKGLLTIEPKLANIPDARGSTPLIIASALKHHAAQEAILAAPDVDLTAKTPEGYSASMCAAMRNNTQGMDNLIAALAKKGQLAHLRETVDTPHGKLDAAGLARQNGFEKLAQKIEAVLPKTTPAAKPPQMN